MEQLRRYADNDRSRKAILLALLLLPAALLANESRLPIADAHVHYSHDSVELTPPQRVIEIMRTAGLKFALVSSSDDNGTQLLSELAPDLIVPGLRPYRRRGELGTWFKDPAALAYVEALLATNRYASIGEFHLYGADADLPIPRRIVELAELHNLVLHAHSDADAVTRLLAQNKTVKVLWAHSGFAEPAEIAAMLSQHDRLWADLAFRPDVGSGGSLAQDWMDLFTRFPDRLMLGTDTYTPERMYFIPEHAEAARVWLQRLPDQLAQNIAWRNAADLLLPVWEKNRLAAEHPAAAAGTIGDCKTPANDQTIVMHGKQASVVIQADSPIRVSEPFSVTLSLCSELSDVQLQVDASMPAHGHGMNYEPKLSELGTSGEAGAGRQFRVEGLNFHMPGQWQWAVEIHSGAYSETLLQDMELN